jgi:hypothetical protein
MMLIQTRGETDCQQTLCGCGSALDEYQRRFNSVATMLVEAFSLPLTLSRWERGIVRLRNKLNPANSP